jgi:hypothetical protein
VFRIGGNTFYDWKNKNSDENSRVQKVRNWINCGILRNSERISQPRGVVGLPMMVLALVIGKGSGADNEGCSNKINNNEDDWFDSCLVR